MRACRAVLVLAMTAIVAASLSAPEDHDALARIAQLYVSARGDREAASRLYPCLCKRLRDKLDEELLVNSLAKVPPRRLLGTRVELAEAGRAQVTCEVAYVQHEDIPHEPCKLYFVKEDGQWRLANASRGMPYWWPPTLSAREQQAIEAARTWLELRSKEDWDRLYELAPYTIRARYSRAEYQAYFEAPWCSRIETLADIMMPEFRTEVSREHLPDGMVGMVYLLATIEKRGEIWGVASSRLNITWETDHWAVSRFDPAPDIGNALRTVEQYNTAWRAGWTDKMRDWLTAEASEAISDTELQTSVESIEPPADAHRYRRGFSGPRLVSIAPDSVHCAATYTMRGPEQEMAIEYGYRLVLTGTRPQMNWQLLGLPTPTGEGVGVGEGPGG